MSADNTKRTVAKASEFCKMGCGFFASGATGDCCSKCWSETMSKEQREGLHSSSKAISSNIAEERKQVPAECVAVCKPVPSTLPAATDSTSDQKKSGEPIKKTKIKKKKTSYKHLISSVKKHSDQKLKIERERQALRKGLGGGAFAKVDRI